MQCRSRVELPEHVQPPIEVYVNGVPQQPGVEYRLEGRSVLFTRELAQEGRLGFWRWISMFFGVAGTYRKHHSVDIVYQAGDKRAVATGLPVSSDHDVGAD